MVMKRRTLAILIGQAFASTALISIPATGSAQQAVERVEITGTNIRRVETETASPVLVITRDDIEKSGKATVAEYLQTLAVDSQGSVPASFGNGFAPGSAGVSLRGLGAGSTLVLINGRRIAPYGLADDGQKVFTDLSVIPMEAVERVEILKDGASAIYGSDAIAGVVNIILRRDFTGTVGKVSFGTSKYHDGNQTRAAGECPVSGRSNQLRRGRCRLVADRRRSQSRDGTLPIATRLCQFLAGHAARPRGGLPLGRRQVPHDVAGAEGYQPLRSRHLAPCRGDGGVRRGRVQQQEKRVRDQPFRRIRCLGLSRRAGKCEQRTWGHAARSSASRQSIRCAGASTLFHLGRWPSQDGYRERFHALRRRSQGQSLGLGVRHRIAAFGDLVAPGAARVHPLSCRCAAARSR